MGFAFLGWASRRDRRREADLAELRAMSDAQLADLGVERSDLEAFLDGARPDEPHLGPRIEGRWRRGETRAHLRLVSVDGRRIA